MNPAQDFDRANPYQSFGLVAADANVDARADFIRKTYLHLAGAVLAFVAIEAVLLQLPLENVFEQMFRSRWSWLVVLGAYMGVSWLANSWALSAVSPGKQYAGLSLFVVAEAAIFAPLLWIAAHYGPQGLLASAAVVTLTIFGGLTAVVMFSKADFSFLGKFLWMAGIAALALIFCSAIFGFNLGIVFIVGMIVLMCGYILYDTSNVLHHYHIGQHVAAALALFASLATLFWYVIQLLWYLQGDD